MVEGTSTVGVDLDGAGRQRLGVPASKKDGEAVEQGTHCWESRRRREQRGGDDYELVNPKRKVMM